MKKLLLLLAIATLGSFAQAQAPYALMPVPRDCFHDATGKPLAGGQLWSYQAGTTTPLATYSDNSGIFQNTNPVFLDSAGCATVWIGATAYKFVMNNAFGQQQWMTDNVSDFGQLAKAGGVFVDLTSNQSIAGNKTFTGIDIFSSLSASNFANVRIADQFARSDCGANINAADLALGTGAGQIWVSQSCGLSITTPVILSPNHYLHFIQGGTYTSCALWTFQSNTGIDYTPAAINEDVLSGLLDPGLVIMQAANCNLPIQFLIDGENVSLQNGALNGNYNGNTAPGGVGIAFDNTCTTPGCRGHFRMLNWTVENFSGDLVQINSSVSGSSYYNQAETADISYSSLSRSISGNGVTVSNTTDVRLFHNWLESNAFYGIREMGSTIQATYNDMSTGKGCVYITATGGTSVQQSGGNDVYQGNACVPTNNTNTDNTSQFGGFVWNGFDGTNCHLVQSEKFLDNTVSSGSGQFNSRYDAFHGQDAGSADISRNTINSNSGEQWNNGVSVTYPNCGGQRDDVTLNQSFGTFGGSYRNFGSTLGYFCGNNDGGSQYSLCNGTNLITPAIGPNGSIIHAIYGNSSTLTYTAIAANNCQEQTIGITNAALPGSAFASPQGALGAGLSWSAWISSANTVAVRVCNVTTGSVTPNVVAWQAWVIE